MKCSECKKEMEVVDRKEIDNGIKICYYCPYCKHNDTEFKHYEKCE